MVRITALPPASDVQGDDESPLVDDSTGDTRKATFTQVKEWLQSLTGWVTTAMLANGAVTAEKLGGDRMFSAYADTAQNSNASGAFVKIALNQTEYDYNNDFDTSTYEYTAASDEVLDAKAATRVNTGGASLQSALIAVYVNGVAVKRGMWTNVNSGSFGGMQVFASDIKLDDGDVVSIYAFGSTSSGTWNMAHSSITTYFTGRTVKVLS